MRRSPGPEWMDDPDVTWPDFDAALHDLARLTRITRFHAPLRGFLEQALARCGGKSLSVLDVGAGGGDVLRYIAAWGARRGVALDLVGLDRSPWAARHAAAQGTPGRWIASDLFDLPETEKFDLVICGLFTHHLDAESLRRFLPWLDSHARIGWQILDLHRHRLSWVGLWLGTRALRLAPMVVHDSTISVARGYVRADWEPVLAGSGAELRWRFPFCWQVRHWLVGLAPDAAPSP